MIDEFEIYMMGEFKIFLGFEVKQLQGVSFIKQTKYTKGICSGDDAKAVKTQ